MEPKDYILTKRVVLDKTLGYEYFLDKNHPLANSQGKVYYHRHQASIKLNEWVSEENHVHHIDGNKSNNNIDNLEVVSKTEHRHIHILEKGYKLTEIIECKYCKKEFKQVLNSQIYCSLSCSTSDFQDKVIISKEVLEKLVWEIPTIKIAEMFNMSDVAIGKRCKKYGISKPPRGYWMKQKKVASSILAGCTT